MDFLPLLDLVASALVIPLHLRRISCLRMSNLMDSLGKGIKQEIPTILPMCLFSEKEQVSLVSSQALVHSHLMAPDLDPA